jgi:hypothetical protein
MIQAPLQWLVQEAVDATQQLEQQLLDKASIFLGRMGRQKERSLSATATMLERFHPSFVQFNRRVARAQGAVGTLVLCGCIVALVKLCWHVAGSSVVFTRCVHASARNTRQV